MYADIRQIIDDIRNNWSAVAQRYQYAKSKYFYHESFISMILFNRTHQNLPKTKLIDYNLPFRYYLRDRKIVKLRHGDEEKTVELPYAEVINFIDEPQATIQVNGEIGQYQQPQAIIDNTKGAFQAFIADRPNDTDGQVLRLADFESHGNGKYSAELESSGYFDEVRTSLTIDYPLDNSLFETMRIRDVTDDGQLRPFGESMLVNHCGVFSAVALYSEGTWYFHMMPRKKTLGVFGGMLSSVSGVVAPPKEPITELVGYMAEEVKREMLEETGLDANELEKTGRCSVIPLAFTRELARGGKPQFFYLTILHDITEKEFGRAFKSAEFKSEFRSDVFSNIKAIDEVVSPEFSTCLYYALLYIQKRRKLSTGTLMLP